MSSKKRRGRPKTTTKKYGSELDRNGFPYVSSARFARVMMGKEKSYKEKQNEAKNNEAQA